MEIMAVTVEIPPLVLGYLLLGAVMELLEKLAAEVSSKAVAVAVCYLRETVVVRVAHWGVRQILATLMLVVDLVVVHIQLR
jgi:hypothetical protein